MSEHAFTNRLATKPAPTSVSTRTTPSTGIPGARKPWSRRRQPDRPIFLSIGYSACHWCHVMEHESFEEPEIASVPQRAFRQHQGRSRRTARPRSDLHDGGATADRAGRLADVGVSDARPEAVLRRHLFSARTIAMAGPSFQRVLLEPWPMPGRRRRGEIDRAAEPARPRHIRTAGATRPSDGGLERQILECGVGRSLEPRVRPARRRLWLRAEVPAPDGTAAVAAHLADASATRTPCTWSAHRSTTWPAAASTITSAAAFIATAPTRAGSCRTSRRCSTTTPCCRPSISTRTRRPASPVYREIVDETLAYVLREMTSPEGPFYSTQDADSEGEEGKFFVWTEAEIEHAPRQAADAAIFNAVYGVEPRATGTTRMVTPRKTPTSCIAPGHSLRPAAPPAGRDRIARPARPTARGSWSSRRARPTGPRRQGADLVERPDDRRFAPAAQVLDNPPMPSRGPHRGLYSHAHTHSRRPTLAHLEQRHRAEAERLPRGLCVRRRRPGVAVRGDVDVPWIESAWTSRGW